MLPQAQVALALAGFALVLPLIYGPGAIAQLGLATVLGPREGLAEPAGWVGRALRAHRNLIENLIPFAVVALLLQVTGRTSNLSELAAYAFLAFRLLHAFSYVLNIKGVRTLVYQAGVVAPLLAALPLLQMI